MKKFVTIAVTAITMCSALAAPITSNVSSNPTVSISLIQELDTNAASYQTGTYKINTSSGSNIRTGAGTNYSKVGAATNGTQFKVTKVSGDWGYTSSIKTTTGTKSGWVHLGYCKLVSADTPSSNYKTGNYKINTSSGSNIRTGAGTNYSKVGAATNGTQFNVTKVSGDWGYTSSIKTTTGTKSGWVHLGYAKYVGTTTNNNPSVSTNTPNNMNINQSGIDFICSLEGFRSRCYYDGAQSSIGYGTKCGNKAHSSGQHTITKSEAMNAMKKELDKYVANVRKQTSGIKMTQNQFNALVSFTYNTGGGTSMIKNSPLVKYLQGSLTESQARSQYANYIVTNSATRKVDQGLINRRKKEADLFFKKS